MNCKSYQKMISKYADNQLNKNDLPLLLDHIKNCSNCNKEFNLMLEVNKNLPPLVPVSLHQNFNTKLLERINSSKKQNQYFPVFLPLRKTMLNYAFLIVFIGLLGFLLNRTACKQQVSPGKTFVVTEVENSSNETYDIVFFDLIVALRTAEEETG